MLLFQKAVVEGSLSLIMQCSEYVDMIKVLPDDKKEKYQLLLEILTPVAKSYPSEMGIESISQGLQCFGGSGYCDDYPLEQYYRDARIHPIHEGTTGIHGITLLGRNVTMKDGRAFRLFLEEVQESIHAAEAINELKPYARELEDALEKLQEVTSHLLNIEKEGNREIFLADATLYLELFGIITITWQWLLQSISVQKALKNKDALSEADANFYQGKMYAFRYFFCYELPMIEGLAKLLLNTDGLTVEMKADYFSD